MGKRAVLIGINKYQVPGADLQGCVNDVKNLSGVLTTYYGFTDKDITTLTDAQATKKAMERAIKKLIRSGKKGDVLLLHYSGHGSNVPDDNGDEADKRDEILCPTDLDWKNPFRDDWLRKTIGKLRSGVNLTVIMDCCHSGTITRVMNPLDAPRRQRYLPCPLDFMATESGRKLRGTVRGQLGKAPRGRRRKKDIVHADIPEMLLTGCRDTQTSADAHIGGSYNGALTYYLVESIKEAEGKLTYRELHQRTTAKLKQEDFDQIPQLEGRRTSFDRLFLG
ncbi:MAG TPA: caspase family protein [Nitrospira sp.]|nr:caspase family protein [Nitrospira sp.]